ncbi:hypothetical protein GGR51DRAFT_561417 [Nemania sp. FL0031]|nr:hypothetical protein GGR51DRAFT_561417 [Nemania sp. FL0031]
MAKFHLLSLTLSDSFMVIATGARFLTSANRIRKVKCDEAHPACSRCISTGRTCDGYGVWGGGGRNGNSHRVNRPGDGVVTTIACPKPLYVPLLIASVVEKEYFDWFRNHTLPKLPGSFNSDFWDTLLPQACLSERAVFNAVLALTSVHRGGYGSLGRGKGNMEPASMKPANEVEIFTLQHYLQAITHLQPYFYYSDRTSFRITLIVCIVFVSIDFLRGNFNSAQNHIHGGLRLIADLQQLAPSDVEDSRVSSLDRTTHLNAGIGDSTDHWIQEVLSRLYIQINLCQPSSSRSYSVPFQMPSLYLLQKEFTSHRYAWLELDRQLHRIFHLTNQARQHQTNSATSFPAPVAVTRLQQSVLTDLEHWLEILKASKESLLGNGDVEYQKGYVILAMYHTMATIMAHTCVHDDDESVFDAYTDSFILLTEQATELCSIPGGSLDEAPPPLTDGMSFDTSRWIVDVGCIPQLYYAALKCRIRHVRHRAVELLQSLVHREGFWDARIAGTVARRVVEAEEGDYYKSFEILCDDCCETSSPPLPECYRLRDVEAVYSGEPCNKVLLFCRRKQSRDDKQRVCIGQYDIASQRWVDVAEQ